MKIARPASFVAALAVNPVNPPVLASPTTFLGTSAADQARGIENARLGQTDFLQSLFQGVLVKLLDADKIDLGNCRTFFQNDHDHIVLDLYANVLEEPRGKKRLDGLGGFLVCHGFADFYRQVAEHRSRFGALNALDADVFNQKRLKGKGGSGKQCRKQAREYFLFH